MQHRITHNVKHQNHSIKHKNTLYELKQTTGDERIFIQIQYTRDV